jgi:hypothetical protein
MAQLSLPPWQELYNSTLNDTVQVTSNTVLNGKLYAKLLVSLEGPALQSIVSHKYLWANGLLLLHELTQTYKHKNVPEVIAAKTSEFWVLLNDHPLKWLMMPIITAFMSCWMKFIMLTSLFLPRVQYIILFLL